MASRKSKFTGTLKLAAVTAVVTAGFFAGRMLGNAERTGTTDSRATAVAATMPATGSADLRTAGMAPGEARSTADVGRSTAAVGKPITPGSYEALVNEHGLAHKSQELAQSFPDTDAGHRLTRMATLLSFGPAPKSPEGTLVGQQVTWLQAHPVEAFKGITDGIDKVPSDYAQERQYLIQFASRLDVDEHTKLDFLSGQLERSSDSAQGFEGAAALSALLEVSRNADEVESTLRSALGKQRDAKSREMLLSLYAAREPDRGQRLKNEFGF